MVIKSFFLGTDTAPHLASDKENCCGCAGIFNATYCISTLAQIFDNENRLSNLEKFISINGAKHYDLGINKEKIKLFKSKDIRIFKKFLVIDKEKIIIFNPGFSVFWDVKT